MRRDLPTLATSAREKKAPKESNHWRSAAGFRMRRTTPLASRRVGCRADWSRRSQTKRKPLPAFPVHTSKATHHTHHSPPHITTTPHHISSHLITPQHITPSSHAMSSHLITLHHVLSHLIASHCGGRKEKREGLRQAIPFRARETKGRPARWPCASH